MNEYEKFGLILIIFASPLWVNYTGGFLGLVLEMILILGGISFVLGHRMSRK